MDDHQRIADLLARYQAGICTEAERELVDRVLFTLDDQVPLSDEALQGREAVWTALLAAVRDNRPAGIRKFRYWIPYAAAMLLAVVVIGYFTIDSRHLSADKPVPADVLPGGNRATLTFDNGRTIELSRNQAGIMVDKNTVKYQNGEILSDVAQAAGNETNTGVFKLVTPNGGVYQVSLSDGTKVLLNAASSLKYPSRFTGGERVVEVTGEAYFSVAADPQRPFLVRSNHQEIEVLGTGFNINAYDEQQQTRTTLISGSVKVQSSQQTVVLKPGQQSLADASGRLTTDLVDVDLAVAWTTGVFYFKRTPFEEVMKQVARWYDMDVIYNSDVPDKTFSGKMKRDVKLSSVLDMMEGSGIQFRIDGNKLIID